MNNHTALHLVAVQTFPLEEETLLEFYTRIITERAPELKKISNVVVADAYFSKETFVSKLMHCGLDVISRLLDDVRLRYIVQIKKTGKRGRTKTNVEKVDFPSLNNLHFSIENENDDMRMKTAIVYAVALKRIVRVVFVEFLKNGKPFLPKFTSAQTLKWKPKRFLKYIKLVFKSNSYIVMQSNTQA